MVPHQGERLGWCGNRLNSTALSRFRIGNWRVGQGSRATPSGFAPPLRRFGFPRQVHCPNARRNAVGALHEPTHPRPLPRRERAFVRAVSVPLPGGVRGGFMIPMHAKKRKEAFHEPSLCPRRRAPPRHRLGGLSSRTRRSTRTSRFKVPMRGQEVVCDKGR